MAKLKRGTVVLVCVAVLGASTGCGSTPPEIPDGFCHVPVKKSALSPLIPNGDSTKQEFTAAQARPGAFCTLHVDSHQVLFAEIARWDRASEPVDWNKVGSPYKYAAKREVSFPGYASIGSGNAIVEATCSTRTGYMSFDIYFRGDRVEETSNGYKKLLQFVNDFVPGATKKFDCTK